MKQPKTLTALNKGFTLIELLVVMGIIAILIAVVAVAVNPGKQFAQARDTQRRADISGVLNAVYQYASDNNGKIPAGIPDGANAATDIGTSGANLGSVLVPTYMGALPYDPSNGSPDVTHYVIFKNGSRVTASASGENTAGYITLTR